MIFRMAVLFSFFFMGQASFSQNLVIGTFNIRYDNPGDSGNLWVNRMPACASLIRFHGFDILGTQEGLRHQLDQLQQQMPEYAFYGKGRDDGSQKGEHSAIFYNKLFFRLLDKGDFWLSETPEKPGWGWDSKFNRICTWVKLADLRNREELYVFNAHFDHQGVKAREESAKLILRKIQEIAGGSHTIFMGDLNGNHESAWYLWIANKSNLLDAGKMAGIRHVSGGSFNGWGSNLASMDIIDHIFVSPVFRVIRYGVLTDQYNGNKFPSDHNPVLAELTFGGR
jgi:endonuclease/exonuclease/phosphatase family metal-dependent hydrolase